MSLREKVWAAFKRTYPGGAEVRAAVHFEQGYCEAVRDYIKDELARLQAFLEREVVSGVPEPSPVDEHPPCWACGVQPKAWFEAQERARVRVPQRVIVRDPKQPDARCECHLAEGGACGSFYAGNFMLEGWPDSIVLCERCEINGHTHDAPPPEMSMNGSAVEPPRSEP
jgi:hypothetical protein